MIWRASRDLGSTISILNDTLLPVTVQQAGLFDASGDAAKKATLKAEEAKYIICVPPKVKRFQQNIATPYI